MKRIILLFALAFLGLEALASEPKPWQLFFQEPATELMAEIIWLHDFIMIILLCVLGVVLGLLIYVAFRFNSRANPVPNKFSHNYTIEAIWTIIPVIILCVICVPTYKLLAKEETIPQADMTVKVVGNQWYWHYEYPDNGKFGFDSYMIDPKNLQPGQKRLLEVDNRIVIPQGVTVKFLITAADVIHSFTVPSMGFKVDAIPGKINETYAKVDKLGVYYGQCSELCGVNHGFMPIAIEVVSKEDFDKWANDAKTKFSSLDSTNNKFAAN